MGLIKAVKDAVGTVVRDQWREYFYCDTIPNDVLVVKGKKRATDGKKNNNSGTDNIITNGSVIAINEGQCMIIVDQGEIVEFCAEPGEYTYEASTEPSLLYGDLGENVERTFLNIGKRFAFGGNTAHDQRVYYFNIKEIMENKFGTATPIPFRVVDARFDLDLDTTIRCNGEYSFKIVDPLLFYKNVCGNVAENYMKDKVTAQMKSELVTALQPALAKLSAMGIRYSLVPAHTQEITKFLNEEMSGMWRELRGVEVVSMTMAAPTLPAEDHEMIQEMQRRYTMGNQRMANSYMAESQAEVFRNMGKQEGGVSSSDMMGNAMGMMAMNMMGNMMNSAGQMNGVQQVPIQNMMPQGNTQAPVLGWTCSCGKTDNRNKFCEECGSPKPAEAGWTCSCGKVNQGKFCPECGNKKPEGAPLYKCDKCGWEPENPAKPPKFCPECGDVFDDSDKQ